MLNVLGNDFLVTQVDVAIQKACFGEAAKIKDNLEQALRGAIDVEGISDARRKDGQERL